MKFKLFTKHRVKRKVKPWVDRNLPKIEHALSKDIDNFYKNNSKLANLY